MAEIKSRIQLKHDTEAHWQLATGFTPKAGEMIVYDADANNPVRYKIGDGTTNINALPFATGTAVLYTSQDIDEDQQKQALINLGLSTEDIEGLKVIEAVTADKVAKKLTAGNKTYDGSTDVTISATDLGLEQAMKFLGTTTTDISDASDIDTIIIGSGTVRVEAGNVVLYNGYEYVWTGSAWEQLGQEGSFVLKSITINGKALNDNITLTAADVDAYSKAEIDTALSSKSNTGHTHSLADINEVEVITNAETVYEKTVTAISDNDTDIGNFPFNKVRSKKTIVTLNGVEYDGEYSFNSSNGTYIFEFGNYTISQNVTDDSAFLIPSIAGETYEIKIDVIEATTIIPEEYIPDRRHIWYAYCRTATDVNTKVVTTTSGNFKLEVGNVVYITFEYPTAVSQDSIVYLKVDETKEIPIHTIGATNTSVYYPWSNYETVGFIYNGFNFEMIDSQIATTTYYGMTKLSSSTSSTATDVAATPSAVKAAYDLANSKADPSTTLAGYGITDAYTKAEIDAMEFITIADIDTICGASIVAATEVTY